MTSVLENGVASVWEAERIEKGGFLGNAFFISHDCLLTARHVVEDCEEKKVYIRGMWHQDEYIDRVYFHDDRDIDIALIKLKSIKANITPLDISNSIEGGITKNTKVVAFGFDRAGGDCIQASLTVGEKDSKLGMVIAMPYVGHGMSGGPTVLGSRVVGVSQVRHIDNNKTGFITVDKFRDFAEQYVGKGFLSSRQSKISTPLQPPANEELRSEIKKEIDKELSRLPLKELQKELVTCLKTQTASGEESPWLHNITDSIDALHQATKSTLQILDDEGAGESTIKKVTDGAELILGWLVMLAVPAALVERAVLGISARDSEFIAPCSTGAGLEILVVRVSGRGPARFTLDRSKVELVGRGRIDGFPESGFGTKEPFAEALKIITQMLFPQWDGKSAVKRDTLRGHLKARARKGEPYYIAIPEHEKSGSWQNTTVLTKLREELDDGFHVLYFRQSGSDDALLISEHDLAAMIYDFLEMLEAYR